MFLNQINENRSSKAEYKKIINLAINLKRIHMREEIGK
jgi:hypothetical protein